MSATEEFKRGWKILLVAAVGLACGLSALPIYTLGVLTKPLSADLGFSRGQVQSIYTWMTIGNLVAAPFLGLLIDRHGVRRVTLISVAALGVGMAAMGVLTESLGSFYVVAFFTAILGVGTVPITWTRAIIDWFSAGRGRALGIALAGTGVSAIFLPTYATWLVAQFGWRGAYVGLGMLPVALALPLSYFLLFDRTAPVVAASVPRDSPALPPPSAFTDLKAALAGYRFWILCAAFFLVGASVAGLIAHLVPMLTDRGVSSATAAQVAGVIGMAVIVGRIGTGFLLDRFWAPGVALILLSLPALSCLVLASGLGGVSAAIFAAALIGLAAGAEFDLMSFLVSKYYAQHRYGILYACIYSVFKLSAGIGAPLFGFSFDASGNYEGVLYLAACSLIAGSALLLVLGPYTVKNDR